MAKAGRSCVRSMSALYVPPVTSDSARMPWTVMLSLVLIGAGGVLAALSALNADPSRWLSVAIVLVLAAGVGVMVLGVGLFAVGSRSQGDARGAFLAASTAGFIAELVALSVLRRRSKTGPGA